ncbi:MAG: metal-dependent transcriptional regulator [Chloroflexi bacterium]|nr:metal-dependent transcriptional regulator [Chloroflexota bacterium]
MAMPKASPTIEDYLLTLYSMERDDVPLISARLAERIGVAPPTVTATLQRMVAAKLVQMGGHKEIELTESGRHLAEVIVRRHALAERLLTDILGLSWHEAHAEAHRMEHAISDRVEARLIEVLGQPRTCPHGNPIPGYEVALTGVPLSTIAAGQEVVVERITEDAEMDPELLKYLEQHDVRPGKRLRISTVAPFNRMLFVQTERGTAPLGLNAAAQIRVNPVLSAES